MSAPNILQVGSPVNIFVECQDCTGDADIRVEILALSYPTKSRRLASTFVTLQKAARFQAFGVIRVKQGGPMFPLVTARICSYVN